MSGQTGSAYAEGTTEAEAVHEQLGALLHRLADHLKRHPPRRSALVRCAMRFRGIGVWLCWREIMAAAEACWTEPDFDLALHAEEVLGEPACNRLLVAKLSTTGLYVSDGAGFLRAVLDAPGSGWL
jgi:hypothetical protein